MSQAPPRKALVRTVFVVPIWLAWIAGGLILGQPETLRFEHITSEHGLSHNTVTAVLQDRIGFMWFGTIDGLNRYDGYRHEVFRHDPADPGSLSSSFIHCLIEDDRGNLWVGTRDGGLSVLGPEDRANRVFARMLPEPGKRDSLSHPLVQTLYIDSRERLWVGTLASLDLYDPASGGFTHYRFLDEAGSPIGINRVLEDSHGLFWVTTFQGLFALPMEDLDHINSERASDFAIHYRHDPTDPASLPTDSANSIFEDREGRLWVSARGGGISLFDRERGGFRSFLHDPRNPTSLSKNNGILGYQDASGYLWVGTDGGGLNILDPDRGMFTRHRHQPSRSDSLSHDNVTPGYQSRDGADGTLWLTTWGGGINKLIKDDKPFGLVRHDPDNPSSPGGNFVMALCEDRFGDLWVGANGKGLSRWNRETDSWQRFYPESGRSDSISHAGIWNIYEDHAGDLWVCTENGLNQLKRKHRDDPVSFIRHARDADRDDLLLENNVRVFFQDREGAFWLGYENRGLSRQTAAQRKLGGAAAGWTHFRHDPQNPRGLSNDQVRWITQDQKGAVWIGTLNGGLNRWLPDEANPEDPGHFTVWRHDPGDPNSLARDDVRAIYQARDGRLWVATFGGGLNLFREETGDFHRYTEANGLANNFVYGILEDDAGRLWLSTNRGLSHFEPETETFTNYGTQHGLQSDEFNTGAFWRGRKELFFGGVNGFNFFQPQALLDRLDQEQQYRPPVVLTGFVNMGEPQSLGKGLDGEKRLTLAHDDKFFSFEFAVLDYQDPARNRFRYRLEGFDSDWIENGNRNFASYTNLDPGRYRLRFQGANSTGAWNEGEPLAILIAPPFWQTWWFRGLALILAALLVCAGFQVKKFYSAYKGLKYVGHFRILRKLGEGGSGTVYQARDKFSKRIVALKVLNNRLEDSRDGVRRFLQEAEIGGRLDHPGIVSIYEAGNLGKTRYICMEYLEGETLKQHLAAKGRMTQSEILPIAGQMLAGLRAIHDHGVVHRDLKSANIMVLEGGQVKIMDFGLARISSLTTMENRGQLMGTLAYMSPEQTLGKAVDTRADIYSFGIILYEMWFGAPPFSADNEMEMIYAIHNEPPRGLDGGAGRPGEAGAEEALLATIARCLEKDPDKRFARVADVETMLDRLALEMVG